MSFRFFLRIRLLPGVTLNLSKRGISASVGARGAHVTIGKTGKTLSAGIPGTGFGWRKLFPWMGQAKLDSEN